MDNTVTDIQKARAIIRLVGGKHHSYVSDFLRSTFWNFSENTFEQEAQRVIMNMEREYVLEIANKIWLENYDEIPDYIKRW